MPPYPKAPPLLDKFQVLASTDLDQVREVTGRLWAEHEVVVRGRVPFRTMINSFQAGETSLSYVIAQRRCGLAAPRPPGSSWCSSTCRAEPPTASTAGSTRATGGARLFMARARIW